MTLPSIAIILGLASSPLTGPDANEAPPPGTHSETRRHAIGSSAFILASLIPSDESPSFFQLNYRYSITPKDVISAEAITWKYYGPLGRQYWDSGDNYPGSVRALGVGIAYQRFLWQGLYAAIHALPLRQYYLNPEGNTIQSGFQLFLTGRIGYHVQTSDSHLFVEPSVAFTTWPINTNLPDSFAAQEDKWSSYFLLEPGLHFGVKF